jgi:16S rRNA (guanine527-N7)-methyltransferase
VADDVSRETFRTALDAGLAELSIDLPPEIREKSAVLYALLLEWNRVHNLTRIVDAAEAARRHFIESWIPLLLPGLFDGVVSGADIGSGAGFPGLPLALALPRLRWTLVESSRKKAAYLTFAAATLGMKNLSVRCADARRIDDRFDLVTFRALTSDQRFTEDIARLRAPGGRLLLFLGPEQTIPPFLAMTEHRYAAGDRTLRFALSDPC